MEPLTAGAIAVGTIVATKALEKTTEKGTEILLDKVGKFLASLKEQSPGTMTVIEKALEEPIGAIDYAPAVLEVESAVKADPKVAQAAQELATAAETDPPSNLAEILREIKEAVNKSQKVSPSFIEYINKAINVAQNQTIDQRNSTFNL